MLDTPINKDRVRMRLAHLRTDRQAYEDHWREISKYFLPRHGRFFQEEASQRGGRRHNAILDNTGTRGLKILASGLMSGMNSPARPWFRLSTSDPELAKFEPVKVWLADTTALMQKVFSRSNTYRSLHTIYEELGAFGTGVSLVLPDYDSMIRHYPLTVGEYFLATDHRGVVNTLHREFKMTVAQVVGEFGRENVSATVRNMYDRGQLDAMIPLVHAIEPRTDRDPRKSDNRNMPFSSVYFETGAAQNQYLSVSGFKEFRALAPRWTCLSGDVYGGSPAMEALGDAKQLQHQQFRKGEAIDYKIRPPLQMPTSMKNREVDTLPGGISYYEGANPTAGIRSAYEVNIDMSHLLADIQDVRQRVNSAFYVDLFLMMVNDGRSGITATEVAVRQEEKMLMLGPVLERLHNELLDPLIELTFSQLLESGALPPPPPEMQGQDLNVDFVSTLAQAQRAVATTSVDRFVSNIGVVASMKPGVLDNFNEDAWAEAYADAIGVDPRFIVPSAQVALVRKQRAEAAQRQQQMDMLQQGAGAMRDASAAAGGMQGLGNVLSGLTGYNT